MLYIREARSLLYFVYTLLAAAFCDLPGIQLTTSSVFITKVQAERIRAPWVKALEDKAASVIRTPAAPAGMTPIALTEHATSTPVKSEARFCNPKFYDMRSSNLIKRFFEFKSNWGLDQRKKMETCCGCFVELMEDPELGNLRTSPGYAKIDRPPDPSLP